jgi:hypothetical protein
VARECVYFGIWLHDGCTGDPAGRVGERVVDLADGEPELGEEVARVVRVAYVVHGESVICWMRNSAAHPTSWFAVNGSERVGVSPRKTSDLAKIVTKNEIHTT